MSETPLFEFTPRERLTYERTMLRVHVAAQLDNLLEDSGLQANELAARMGKGRSWISKLLNGRQNATLDTLAEAAAALGARWDAILVPAERAGTAAEADPPAPLWMQPRASNYIIAEITSLLSAEPITVIKDYAGAGAGWSLNQVSLQMFKFMGDSHKVQSNLTFAGPSPSSTVRVKANLVSHPERLLSDAES